MSFGVAVADAVVDPEPVVVVVVVVVPGVA